MEWNTRIAIVGVGRVGAATAFALLLNSIPSELLLVDINKDLRDAQVRDLSDAALGCSSSTRVRSATHQEAGQCDIAIITAGSRYTIGRCSHPQSGPFPR